MNNVLDFLDIRKIASKLGFGLAREKTTKNIVPLPKNVKYLSNFKDFGLEWQKIMSRYPSMNTRPVKLDSYKRMDTYGALCAKALNTFADESLGITSSSLPSIEFSINDTEIERKVKQIIEMNGLFTNAKIRQDVRSLCKFGDIGYTIQLYRQDQLMGSGYIVENIQRKENRIDEPFVPEEIQISYITPEEYSLSGFRGQVYSMKAINRPKEVYSPWEFVLFCIEDRESFPYGKSILEQARIPFEVLTVSEQLLQMCRASKVERWVIKVQDGSDQATDFERFQELRSDLENMRWQSGIQGSNPFMNRNSDTSLITTFFIPESLNFEKVRNDIDVSDMEDIKYHQDKLIMALDLPRSFLIADDVSDIRGNALEQQDIVFARKIPFIQNSYMEGCKKLITLMAYYLGANLDTLKVNVSIKVPHRLSGALLEQYTQTLEFISLALSQMKEINPKYTPTLKDLRMIVYKAGLDPEILNIPGLINSVSGGEFDTFELEPRPGKEESLREDQINSNLNYMVKVHTETQNITMHNKLYKCFTLAEGYLPQN